jgi:hypothetical protein
MFSGLNRNPDIKAMFYKRDRATASNLDAAASGSQ